MATWQVDDDHLDDLSPVSPLERGPTRWSTPSPQKSSTLPTPRRGRRGTVGDEESHSPPPPTLQRGAPHRQTEPVKDTKGSMFSLVTRRKYIQLKTANQQLRDQNSVLTAKLDTAMKLYQGLHKMIVDHPVTHITGGTVNFQCTANILETIDDENVETLLDDLGSITETLTVAVEDHTRMRAEAEAKQRNSEVLLEEMKCSVECCQFLLKQLDSKTSNKLKNIKCLLESMGTDRSDDRLLSECVCVLEKRLDEYKFVSDPKVIMKSLPPEVTIATNRIMKKFRFHTWEEFAELLGIDPSMVRGSFSKSRAHDSDDVKDDMCVKSLIRWMKKSTENDEQALIRIVKEFEAKRCQERSTALQRQSLSQRIPGTTRVSPNDASGRQATATPDHVREREPDERSKFQHMLESIEYQIAMDNKLNRMDRNIEEIKSLLGGKPSNTNTTKVTENEEHLREIHDAAVHFV